MYNSNAYICLELHAITNFIKHYKRYKSYIVTLFYIRKKGMVLQFKKNHFNTDHSIFQTNLAEHSKVVIVIFETELIMYLCPLLLLLAYL